jgi:hypothetical protein
MNSTLKKENETMNSFIEWYDDNQLWVMEDIVKEGARRQYYQETNALPRRDDWGSSSVEPITWGLPVKPNHEEDLKRWNEIPKDNGKYEEELQQEALAQRR